MVFGKVLQKVKTNRGDSAISWRFRRQAFLSSRAFHYSNSKSKVDVKVSSPAKFFRKSKAIWQPTDRFAILPLCSVSYQVEFQMAVPRDPKQIEQFCIRQSSSECHKGVSKTDWLSLRGTVISDLFYAQLEDGRYERE